MTWRHMAFAFTPLQTWLKLRLKLRAHSFYPAEKSMHLICGADATMDVTTDATTDATTDHTGGNEVDSLYLQY